MEQRNSIRIRFALAAGARAEHLDQAARSLVNELNHHRRGAASLTPSLPSESSSPDGMQNKDFLGLSAEIVLAGGSLASAWIVPAVQNWLSGQNAVSGIIFTLKDDNGDDYDVTIGPNAPADVVAKISSAVVRASKA